MKRNLRFFAGAFLLTATALFTACSQDDDFFTSYEESAIQTRAGSNSDGSYTITFDDFSSSMMAGPTSQGTNCLIPAGSSATESEITEIVDNAPDDYFFFSIFNTLKGNQQWSRGGVALSKWNYRSNPTNITNVSKPEGTTSLSADWWYSWYNQCSVYNLASTDGANQNAGHSGSNFGVVYGYNDTWMEEIGEAEFYFDRPRKFVEFWYANTSYTYGVILNGNSFASSLRDNNGWFKVTMYLYDIDGNLLTTQEKYLADYRTGHTTVTPVTTWTQWNVNVDNVMSVKFDFTGSDTGTYGLNTPAYLCIDDLKIK